MNSKLSYKKLRKKIIKGLLKKSNDQSAFHKFNPTREHRLNGYHFSGGKDGN